MEALVGIAIGMAVAVVVTAWMALTWLYQRDNLPPLGVIVEDLRFLRTMLRINEVSDQAITAMQRWAARRR